MRREAQLWTQEIEVLEAYEKICISRVEDISHVQDLRVVRKGGVWGNGWVLL